MRARIGALALTTVLLMAFAPAAEAAGARTFRAPFTQTSALGYQRLTRPCTQAASPVALLSPKAAGGRLDISEGATVSGCTGWSAGRSFDWRIGAAPAAMVGRPAIVTFRIAVESSRIASSGSARRFATAAFQALGSSWTLVSITCDGGNCSTIRPRRVMNLRVAVPSLPSVITSTIRSDAAVTGGTGTAGVELRGILRSVTIRSIG